MCFSDVGEEDLVVGEESALLAATGFCFFVFVHGDKGFELGSNTLADIRK